MPGNRFSNDLFPQRAAEPGDAVEHADQPGDGHLPQKRKGDCHHKWLLAVHQLQGIRPGLRQSKIGISNPRGGSSRPD